MNKDYRSFYRWGGTASILMTIAFLWIGIAIMLDPVERVRGEAFFFALAENPTIQMSWRYAFFAVGLLALAFIPAATHFVRHRAAVEDGFLHWATILAYIGSASLAIDTMRGIYIVNNFLIDAYNNGTATEQLIAKVALSSGTDVEGFFQYGGVGLWYIAVSLAGLRSGVLPHRLGYVGVAAGLAYISTLVFGLTDTFIPGADVAVQALAALVAGVIIGPIFHIWFGLRLLRAARQSTGVHTVETLPQT